MKDLRKYLWRSTANGSIRSSWMCPNLSAPRNPNCFGVQLNSRHVSDVLDDQLDFRVITTRPILRNSHPVLSRDPRLDIFGVHLRMEAICGQTLFGFAHPKTIRGRQISKSSANSSTSGHIRLVQITEHAQNDFRWHIGQIASIVGVVVVFRLQIG